jgi:predicted translin family RNA/ssDNA-binding protein
MLDKNLIKKLKKDYLTQEKERRQIIRQSNEILFQSKKIIFALHRNNNEEADNKINELTKSLKKMEKDFNPKRLQSEGAFQAAAEEYIEAVCFQAIVKENKIKKIKDLNLNHYSYVGGICDLIGEMVRYASNQVSQGNFKIVNKLKNQAQDIMAELANFDFTGYLRTKYDQANNHLRKLEQMSYDIKLKEKN